MRRVAGVLASIIMLVGLLVGCGSGGANVSCSPSHEYSNSYGTISAQQQSSGGSIQWGAYPTKNIAGTYTADVYLDGKRFDGKVQNYPPHGSVPASAVKSGAIFRLEGSYSGVEGEQSFWLECRAA